jgi:hypothetical protein
MFDSNPTRDQEPGVIGDEMKVPSLGFLIPTDELISSLYLPGGACPGKAGATTWPLMKTR